MAAAAAAAAAASAAAAGNKIIFSLFTRAAAVIEQTARPPHVAVKSLLWGELLELFSEWKEMG